MRKEIRNLRQMLDSATRAHRKSISSLQSVMSEMNVKKDPCKARVSTNTTPLVNALEEGTIQTVPIGFLKSCFSAKNGTPRQPTICGPSRAELRIRQSVFNNPEHALVGLEQYSHVWIIFVFHKNGHLSVKAKVKPPRLNGQKVGVYSTRTPHRPNALGLTLAKLDKVVGDTLHLSNIDMIDGTPVLDIKPYIPDYDSIHTRDSSESHDANLIKSPIRERCPQKQLDSQILEKTAEIETEETELNRQKLEQDETNEGSSSWHQLSNLQSALEEVKAYVTQTSSSLESEEEVSSCPEMKTSECSSELPRYGEEAYSTIASWIREPPVSSLEVRFTAHAEKELAEFLPAGCNRSNGPTFKFLRSTEEAIAAIRGVLSADPRSVYRRARCTDKLFYFTLDTADVTCWFGHGFAEVLQVRPVQQL